MTLDDSTIIRPALSVESDGASVLPQHGRRAYLVAFAVIIVLAGGVRCRLITHAVAVGRDAARHYLPQALAISRMQLDQGFHTGIPPLYPVLGGLTTMIIGDAELACRLVSLVSGLAAVLLVWFLAGRLFGHWPALLAAALIAFNPYQCRFSAEVGLDSLAAALLLAAAVLLVEYLLAPSVWRAAMLGALLALLALTRPESIFYAPVVLVMMVLLPADGATCSTSRRFAHAGFLLAVAIALCLPRLLWVHHQTGTWVMDTRQISGPLRLWHSFADRTFRYGQVALWRRGGLKAFASTCEAFVAAFGPVTLLLGSYAVVRWRGRRRRLQYVPGLLLIFSILLMFFGNRLSKRYLLSAAALWQVWGGAGLAMLACLIWSHLRRAKPSARLVVLPYLLAAAITLLQVPWAVVNLKQSRLAERRMGQWILDNLGPGQHILAPDAIPAWYARAKYSPWPMASDSKPCRKAMIHYAQATDAALIIYDDRLSPDCPELAEDIANNTWPLGPVLHQIHDRRHTLTLLRIRRQPI